MLIKLNPNRLSMYYLAAFMIDFDIENMDDLDFILDSSKIKYALTGTDAKEIVPGDTSEYNFLAIRACVKKIKRLPKKSRTGGDSWETLRNIHIPNVYLCRACGISDFEYTFLPLVNTAEIDATAKKIGISRGELLKRALKKCKQYNKSDNMVDRSLSYKCAMYAHRVLQCVVQELTRLGFKAEYIVGIADFSFAEKPGYFGVGVEGNHLLGLCNSGKLPAAPWIREDADITELEIFYERPEGADEQPIFDALKMMGNWADALREIEPQDIGIIANR